MTDPLSDKDIIKRLGGPVALKDALPYSEEAIRAWTKIGRGIPWKARLQIKRVASAKRIKLPANFLEERAT